MARSVTRVEGMEEIHRNLDHLIKAVDPAVVEPLLLDAATTIADDARSRAPRGPTGNLKRGIIAKQLKRLGQNPASALAGIDYRIAPHAHLVEFGTVKSAPHPFFRPAWDLNKGRVEQNIKNRLEDEIKDAL